MHSGISAQKVYEALRTLPDDNLEKVLEYIEFNRHARKNHNQTKNIKPGGLLEEYKIDISEDDIA